MNMVKKTDFGGNEYPQAFLEWAGIEVCVEALEETIPPEDSFCDDEDVKFVCEGIKNGNEWAWCCVRVRVGITNEFGFGIDAWDFYEDEYLGGCSYQSEEDFIESSGYYRDMVDSAVERLLGQIWKMRERVNTLFGEGTHE